MRYEIEKHWDKLKHISKLTDTALNNSLLRLYTKINFINEELIPETTWLKAEALVKEIDPDDIDFIALTEHLKGTLWTGDKELYNGLKNKSYQKVVNTPELLQLRIKNAK